VCEQEALYVTLVLAGQPDPRLTPETPDMPERVSMLMSHITMLLIEGGSVTYSIGVGNDRFEPVKDALLAKAQPSFQPSMRDSHRSSVQSATLATVKRIILAM
jgi:hypothetical protein